ncbi:Thiol-disulfide oxidoreductase D [Pannonibacter phragmitetus]|uniref:Thiol-disulfide oxidoreductase D n=1 Tax=Pannonibacter phragmitetus TaxID=121719 RepID=A0A378ZRT9_9HYPH|nr:DsbA family protein [Pannonibacter phragmitetus]SUA99867.1 Thiol-disulfide oxidoreductase D [Pannonibacter phragmitetus]
MIVNLTRRQLLASAAATTFAAALATSVPAFAQSADVAKLMEPGPLGDMVLGNEDAPVTIIEYASLTCGHCANFHKNTLPELKKQYIDTGKAKIIMREFPLDPVASGGFMLARCAPQDKYFDVLSAMFADQRSWAFTQDPYNAMLNFSKQLGFTQESFEACLGNQQLLDGITAVQERASKEFGVNSTPTFFVNGERIVGASSFDEFSKVIEKHL